MRDIIIAGWDPSFRNWGHCLMSYSPSCGNLEVIDAGLNKTPPPDNSLKSVSDFLRAKDVWVNTISKYVPDITIAELPTGSQSARAAKLLGLCSGLLAAYQTAPLILVTPTDVKKVTSIHKPDKKDMIAWASERHPGDFWLRRKNGALLNDNEHIADSIAVVYAGLLTKEFNIWLNEQM